MRKAFSAFLRYSAKIFRPDHYKATKFSSKVLLISFYNHCHLILQAVLNILQVIQHLTAHRAEYLMNHHPSTLPNILSVTYQEYVTWGTFPPFRRWRSVRNKIVRHILKEFGIWVLYKVIEQAWKSTRWLLLKIINVLPYVVSILLVRFRWNSD